MKYYIYVSDSKISMLHAQILQSNERTREASLGFDVKVLKGHIKESRGIPQNSLTRLDEVLRTLHASELVGSIDEPKQYIRGTLPMTWSTYDASVLSKDSPITFWGFCEQLSYPFAGTVLALAGSKHHLLGEQRDGHAHSHSLTPAMTLWFLKNLEDPFTTTEMAALKSSARYADADDRLTDRDVANAAWLAATQVTGAKATYEFVAKVLHRSDWPEGFRSKTTRVILGSPLYVAITE